MKNILLTPINFIFKVISFVDAMCKLVFMPKNAISPSHIDFSVFTATIHLKTYKLSKSLIIGLLLLLVGVGSVNGITYTAIKTGNWSDPTTWGTSTIPGASNDVTISGNFTVYVDVNTAVCANMILGVPGSGDGTLIFSSPTSQLTLNNLKIGQNKIFAGFLNMTNGGILKIGGTITLNGLNPGDWIPGSGTIDYNGSANNGTANQSIYANVYNNLTLSGSGIKTLPTGTTINGILSLEGTSTTAGTVPIYGSEATLQYEGSAAQTTGIEFPATFNGTGGVIINNDKGVTLSSTKTVSFTTLISSTNSGLIIPPGICLTSKTITTTNDKQIYIKASPDGTGANGSLIFHNAQDKPVYGTVEMYSKASKATNYKWQFFGIPLRTMSPSPTFDGSYVRQMFETGTTSAEHWLQLTNASNLTSFTGYEITQLSPKTIYFQGELENNDFNSGKLSYTTIGATYPGQHLIGNPYTAAIDIKKIVFGSTDPAIIENTVYLYSTGSFADWTSVGSGVGSGTSAGQYIAVPVQNAGANGLPAQIPSMQAFLLRVKSGNALATVSIPYSAAGTVVKNTDMQRTKAANNSSSSDKVCTMIDVKGARFSDRMWIFSEPTCTRGFDNGWDGVKFLGSALSPQLFAMEVDGDYQVDAVADMNNTELGFQAGEDVEYTFTFNQQNITSKYAGVYLVDSVENKTVDITESGSTYKFVAESAPTKVNRFKIITRPNEKDAPDADIKVKLFSSKGTIFVQNISNSNGELSLYDMAGHYIKKVIFGANEITTVSTNINPGVYVAKALTNGEEITKRLIVW